MTICTFRHEAGSEHDALAARLERALADVAPLVGPITGLPLPQDPPPVVRLVSRRTWHKAHRVHHDKLFWQETREVRMTRGQVIGAWRHLGRRRKQLHARWINVAAMLAVDRKGRPQVLAIADALHHTGASDGKLVKLAGHELVHLAQHHASRGLVIRYANSWVVRSRAGDPAGAPLDFFRLTEGHAMWAEEQMTMSLLGRTVPFSEGTYTELGRRESERWVDAQNSWIAGYTAGHEFVRHVIAQRGREAFNEVWRSPQLCPTGPEIDAPATYVRYTNKLAAAANERRTADSGGRFPGEASGGSRGLLL